MLDVESSPIRYPVSVAAILRLGFLFLILCSLGFLFFSDSLHDPRVESLTPTQRVAGEQVKPYLEEHFRQARWYSLIETIETNEDQIIIKTFIFPDQDGRVLADEIVDDLRRQGIRDDISVYGRNISYSLLTRRYPSSKIDD